MKFLLYLCSRFCGVSTSVVHQLPKLRRRVRLPYTAHSRSVYRCGGKESRCLYRRRRVIFSGLISSAEESPGSTEQHSG